MKYISEFYLKRNLIPSAFLENKVLVVGLPIINRASSEEVIEIDNENTYPMNEKCVWIFNENESCIQCSSCKFKLPVNLKKLDSYNYCPNCGARMININKIKTFIK